MSMNIRTEPGDEVIFTGKNGYDHQNRHANSVLTVGEIYTLKSIKVGNWESHVELEEVEGSFNSVHFMNKEYIKDDLDFFDSDKLLIDEPEESYVPYYIISIIGIIILILIKLW